MKMLFLAPDHLSRGDAAIAADLARQMPRRRFQAGFLASAESLSQLHDLGMPTLPLTGSTPEENLAILDRVVRGFRPDCIVAADAFAVNHSCDWSGLTMDLLRERYGCPVGSIDRLGWQAAGYTADFYGGARVKLPCLLDDCDLVVRTCPPHAPLSAGVLGDSGQPGKPIVVWSGLHRGGLYQGGLRSAMSEDAPLPRTADLDLQARAGGRPIVFIANSEWEHRNPRRSLAVARLIDSLPRVLHSHLEALERPLQVVHVGPNAWRFSPAHNIEYRHFKRLPYPMFHAWLSAADLFVSTNMLSATLGRAVLAGVPALVLQSRITLEGSQTPQWLAKAAPQLGTAYPFRVAPLGWHDLLAPLLSDNPYRNCFAVAEIFDREAVLGQMSVLLDDELERSRLRDRQEEFNERLAGLPQPLEALRAVVAR